MSAPTLSVTAPTWVRPSQSPVLDMDAAPEGRWGRMLRWLADRRQLREMDERLLRDVGLTRGDVLRGVPFRIAPPCPDARGCPAMLTRLGNLESRGWRLKLYAPTTEAAGLRPEDLAAARRALRAVLAEPACGPVAGFAMLATGHDDRLPAGGLVLTAYRREGPGLRRSTLLLPTGAGPVRRLPDHPLSSAEVLLAAREDEAWRRHGPCPSPSSLTAYLAESCA